jgi:hypothetical protein
MVTSILKTTEIDLIWFMIYLGMFTGLFTIGILAWGMYHDLRNKDK